MDSIPITAPAIKSAVLMVTRWDVVDGTFVAANDPVCEIEIAFVYAPKVEYRLERINASASGVVRHGARTGEVVGAGQQIGQVIPR